MQGISLFVVLAIAAVSGQVVINGGNLPVNGGSAVGASNDYYVNYLYSVYIPANTLVFNFTVTSTSAPGSTDSCSYYVATKNYGFPCDYVPNLNGGEYFCEGYVEIGGVSNGSPDTYTFTAAYSAGAAGFSYERIHLPSNNYMFFQVYSYSSGNCAFTVSTSSSNCSTLAGGVGQIGASYYSSSSVDASSILGNEYCVAPTSIPNTGSNFIVANVSGPIVYNATLPLNTAYVNVTFTFAARDSVNFGSATFYVYANAGHAGADNSNSYCYEYASSNTTAMFQCTYTPAGPFFVQVYPSYSDANPRDIIYYGNITITPVVCAAGTLGPLCQPISFSPAPLLAGQAVNATVPAGSEYFTYIDVPSAIIGTNFSIFYQGSASLYLSRSFVSTYTYSRFYYQYFSVGTASTPEAVIHLAEFDLNNFFGGFDTSDALSLKLGGTPLRFYMSFACSGSTACPISLSAAVQQTATTGATGASTASVSTASTASASTASASTASASTASASTASASTASASTTRSSTASASTASASTTRGSTASASTAAGTTGSSASTVVASFAVIVAIIAMMF